MTNDDKANANANAAKKEAAKKPNAHDVHEQREEGQAREGVVRTAKDPNEGKIAANTDGPKNTRPPAQSILDMERGDGEGMGQGRYQPEEPTPASHS